MSVVEGMAVPLSVSINVKHTHKKPQNDRIIDYFYILVCSIPYTQYAIRNTLYSTRYTRIEYPESSNDLCKTNPICYSNKMNTTFLFAKDYEPITMNNEPEKQTQSKPILSASGGFKCDLVQMGHHEDMFWFFVAKWVGFGYNMFSCRY